MNGLMFALITTVSLLLCLSDISQSTTAQAGAILPFFIAIISLLLGLFTMLRDKGRTKEKVQ